MKNTLVISVILLVLPCLNVDACTSIIISGKNTPDGRPIMWKNRDTDTYQNAIKYFNDGKYNSIGLIDSDDPSGKSVWIGYNSAGFAIMNGILQSDYGRYHGCERPRGHRDARSINVMRYRWRIRIISE